MAVQIPNYQSSRISDVLDMVVEDLKHILATLTTENMAEVSRAIGVLEILSATFRETK